MTLVVARAAIRERRRRWLLAARTARQLEEDARMRFTNHSYYMGASDSYRACARELRGLDRDTPERTLTP